MKKILSILILILLGCTSSKKLNTSHENSIGEFKVNVFEDCGTGGVENVTYKYRIGNWTFYYPNGQIKAKGSYKIIKTEISTRCELNEKIEFSELGNNWKFYDINGVITKPTEKMINELTCVTQEKDGELIIQFCYDKEKNRVDHNIITEKKRNITTTISNCGESNKT